jgi:hypothetical protein
MRDFWRWTPLPGIRSPDSNGKQAPHALWLSNSNRTVHADIVFTSVRGTRPLVPTAARAIRQIRILSHSFLDENALGKNCQCSICVADQPLEFSREGDQFIMQVLIKAGYTSKAISCLNKVRVSLQLLFMLDILTASGNKVCTDFLLLATRRSMVKNEVASQVPHRF